MTAGTVLVAHESETIRGVIGQLLDGAGYQVSSVADGRAALSALSTAPAAIVLDVALPGVHAYEVVEETRRRSAETRVVLVASVYNRTGYKRRPTSLYGADDYVEQHHIPDALVDKVARLIGPPPRLSGQPLPPAPAPHADTAEGRSIRSAGERRMNALGPAEQSRMVERAERLARIIVADIALYNGDALDHADRTGEDSELEGRLRLDLEEGRLLFDLRVPKEVRELRDFIGEALAALRAERRAHAGDKGAG
jgi:CheY-like chemotaxis protein